MNAPIPTRRQILTAKLGLLLGGGSLVVFAVAHGLAGFRGFASQSESLVAAVLFAVSALGLIAAVSARTESDQLRLIAAAFSLLGLLAWGLVIMGQGI